MEPKFGEYFVAKVSLRKNNPAHRVVAFCNGQDRFDLWCGGYEEPQKVWIPGLLEAGGTFEILMKLEVMK